MTSGKSLELQQIPKPTITLVWPSKQLGTFSPRKPQFMTQLGKQYFLQLNQKDK